MVAFSQATINHQTRLKILFDLCLKCQAIQNTCKVHVYVVYMTNTVEITLQIHSGKNTAVDENLNESGKELS